MVAPNLLRVGTPEKVFVEAQDYSENIINVRISVKNHPKKTSELTTASVDLTAANNYQGIVDIKVGSLSLSDKMNSIRACLGL